MSSLVLLPRPRSIELTEGRCALTSSGFIYLVGSAPDELLFSGQKLQAALRDCGLDRWEIAARSSKGESAGIYLIVEPAMPGDERYQLRIANGGIVISASGAAGIFYGAQTLIQLLRQVSGELPAMRIEDWPDFPSRGVMLDISRDKVPSMETLYALVDQLAEWKINQFQLYTEHTFAYQRHPAAWSQASPMTGEEILALDKYCRQRFIELVPNQNSFGHMERWLNLPEYEALAEAPNGAVAPWGAHFPKGFSLCPGDPKTLSFLAGLYDELLPHFSSRNFNVGCDETFDIGQGRSKDLCDQHGRERVYLEFLLKIYDLVKARGRTMQFWGDIIINRPQLIGELPKDIIALEWGYEADHPFDKHCETIRNAGVPFYVCPGTSTWSAIAGRTENAIANLTSAAKAGQKHGAAGFLITDWGDHGHWQPLSASYLPYSLGAALSWCFLANEALRGREALAEALNVHVFKDRAGVMGQAAYDLGNVYRIPGKLVSNSSILMTWLTSPTGLNANGEIGLEKIQQTEAAIYSASDTLHHARMRRGDGALIIEEFRQASAQLEFACLCYRTRKHSQSAEDQSRRKALQVQLADLIVEHKRLWLCRNRAGGLEASCAKMEKIPTELPSL